MDLEGALQTFIAESRDLLTDMETELLGLEPGTRDPEILNAIFRVAHTIKGSAGLFDLDPIVAFTHEVETLLDRIRCGDLACDEVRINLLLACRDHMSLLVENIGTDRPGDEAHALALRTALHDSLGQPQAAAAPSAPERVPAPTPAAGGGVWHLSLRFGPDVLRDGMDPASFISYLEGMGTIHALTTLDTLPPALEMDPEACYLGLEIDLETGADRSALEEVFEFVREESTIRLLPPDSTPRDFAELIRELPGDDGELTAILTRNGTLNGPVLAEVCRELDIPPPADDCTPARQDEPAAVIAAPFPQPAPGAGAADAPEPAPTTERPAPARKPAAGGYVRVQADRLDALINLVGELVIASAASSLHAGRTGNRDLSESTAQVGRLVEEIRDNALRLRMVAIGETFNRFRRVVHDVGRELGKDVELVINGADTELDKTVVEKIGDPLTHLIRNAMDHGIEPTEQRLTKGKPPKGTLELNACHESGSIVIEIRDDGKGLDREKILAKARDRGLVGADQQLSDAEVWALIFAPGLSTAESVSNLSGRGVGMDVVRRNIEALRGSVEIDSRPGEGTTVRIRLPLTLAIIDGFLMRVGEAHYVVPLDQVVQCEELSAEDRRTIERRGYLNLRGEALPVIRMSELFGEPTRPGRRENIVVVQYGNTRAGLVVDELLGEHQTVIKPLGEMFAHLRGISGATILGSGAIALILDVPTLIQGAVEEKIPEAQPDIRTEARVA